MNRYNEDYLLRCILNAERFHDNPPVETVAWDTEIQLLELMRSNELMRNAA